MKQTNKIMQWVKASERLPKEHTWVIFQWEDTKNVFREKPFNLRDENGNIGGLVLLKWLDEAEAPNEAGERRFTLDEALEIWDAGAEYQYRKTRQLLKNEKIGTPNKKQYFKEKFGIGGEKVK